MTLRFVFAISLVHAFMLAQDAPKAQGRFFNDSAKAVNFYIDGQYGCSVSANPEENNAYCDAEIGTGKHTLSVKGPKLTSQSCEIFVGANTHAEANFSKGERLYCRSVLGKMD